MCMIDITNIEAKENDEVVIFESTENIENLAKELGTIPYEILTNVSRRVKRVYFDHNGFESDIPCWYKEYKS